MSNVAGYEDAGQPFGCDIKCRVVFKKPLTLNEMKKDPELRSETLVQQEFQTMFGPPLIEHVTLNRLAAKIPELSRLVATGSK
ncbi:MAG: EVE domain-containing protein [Pirellulaceae bacterium]|nr:EVE domain-containing protein [Pirellulaceae bacterium]